MIFSFFTLLLFCCYRLPFLPLCQISHRHPSKGKRRQGGAPGAYHRVAARRFIRRLRCRERFSVQIKQRERAATRTRLSTPLNSFDCAEKKTRGSACSLKFQELVKEYIKYKNRRVETGTLFLSVHGCVDF